MLMTGELRLQMGIAGRPSVLAKTVILYRQADYNYSELRL